MVFCIKNLRCKLHVGAHIFGQKNLTKYCIFKFQLGGCKPFKKSSLRILTTPLRLRCSVLSVARPTSVKAIIFKKSSDQVKCSFQSINLGWNSGTICPVKASFACVLLDLCALQPPQAQAKFSKSSVPPLLVGVICSISKD